VSTLQKVAVAYAVAGLGWVAGGVLLNLLDADPDLRNALADVYVLLLALLACGYAIVRRRARRRRLT
jgi:drug/metabolite transporter (DMT)-like permease